MYNVVSVELGNVGTCTHANSAPVAEVYDWIWWLSLVTPSELVNRMSLPLDCALLARSASEFSRISTG